jgi:UDP:flavonoid glycosyltransferase YjiC (YdhE family)
MPRMIPRRAKLVDGSHATAMRALRHGVPIVAIPGFAGDPPDVAAVAIRRTIRRAAA